MILKNLRTGSALGTLAAAILAVLLSGIAKAGMIDISLATVGNPGNVADPTTGFGAVPNVYQIGEFDVTIAQYTTFLNAVATTGDPYGLYNPAMSPSPVDSFRTLGISQSGSSGHYSYSVAGSYSQAGNCPIFDVTWGDAARFVNWMQNGQPTGPEGSGTTETGTYALNGGTTNVALMAATRSPTASWVLPTVNEWYKAAYYVGGGTNAGYWTYATQSNDAPSNLLSATGTNNANYFNSNDVVPPNYGASDHLNHLTPVGAFADSPSAYGTYDQSGDVWNWNETADGTQERGLRGGSYGGGVGGLIAQTNDDTVPADEGYDVGFRVGYVPEPGTAAIVLTGALSGLLRGKLRRPKRIRRAF